MYYILNKCHMAYYLIHSTTPFDTLGYHVLLAIVSRTFSTPNRQHVFDTGTEVPWLSDPRLSGTSISYPKLKMTILLEYFKYRCAFYFNEALYINKCMCFNYLNYSLIQTLL